MTPQKSDENGAEPRLEFNMQISTGKGRKTTATVVVTALDDEQQARFDAEIEDLLAQLARQQVQWEN